jgi:hypothetical protein
MLILLKSFQACYDKTSLLENNAHLDINHCVIC